MSGESISSLTGELTLCLIGDTVWILLISFDSSLPVCVGGGGSSLYPRSEFLLGNHNEPVAPHSK